MIVDGSRGGDLCRGMRESGEPATGRGGVELANAGARGTGGEVVVLSGFAEWWGARGRKLGEIRGF